MIFDADNLPELLTTRLREPLPGWRAQQPFQTELSFGRYFGPTPSHARKAAVMLLLYRSQAEWRLPLTLRPDHLTDHAGQISLPGGAIDSGERSADAALRELDEELGIDAAEVELVGELSPLYLFRSHFCISPWLGVLHAPPQWKPNSAEVAELIELPLGVLVDPNCRQVEQRIHRGVEMAVPGFEWNGQLIWGATSMILHELAAILSECLDIPQ
jgi:8-oxo-dGTP pyrophosphatase MutT (NUDIX family)